MSIEILERRAEEGAESEGSRMKIASAALDARAAEVEASVKAAFGFVDRISGKIDAELAGMGKEAQWIHLAALEAILGAWIDQSGNADALRGLWSQTRQKS